MLRPLRYPIKLCLEYQMCSYFGWHPYFTGIYILSVTFLSMSNLCFQKEHLFCLLLHLWDPRTYLLKQCHIKAGVSLVAALKATVKAQMSSRGNITLNPESVNEFIKGAHG